MFHENRLPVNLRVAARKVDIARALNLEDENEIAAAVEEISHVLYSPWLVFRHVDRLASEAKQRQALQRLTKVPNPTIALIDQQDARVANRIALHLPGALSFR